MSQGVPAFDPWCSLISGIASRSCRACVVIPARNEEAGLARCLDAFCRQLDLNGEPLPHSMFEVILFLNNCTDASAAAARRWRATHPEVVLHIAERTLPAEEAHVGTARRWLMDTAWHRLGSSRTPPAAILCTDADTIVAPDWIVQNLCALGADADVVGGQVDLLPSDLDALPLAVQRCHQQDRRYAALVARLEDLLDPQSGDRWPRHLDHFGSSLACTPSAYAAAGGMPPIPTLEDEAFVDRARHADLRLRHEPAVRVCTSARLDGRAAKGMARQLCLWHDLSCESAHTVASAAFLQYRFRFMRRLRDIYATKDLGGLVLPTDWWRDTFRQALEEQTTCPGFLGAVYCNILIAESFTGPQEVPIAEAIQQLAGLVAGLEWASAEERDRTHNPDPRADQSARRPPTEAALPETWLPT